MDTCYILSCYNTTI